MAIAPYDAPAYFPTTYFYASSTDSPAPSSGPTPYDAPTYFPASYFYSPASAVAPAPSSGPCPYDAPTYFAPAYFPGGAGAVSPAPPAPPQDPGGLDGAAYSAVLALLSATGLFDEVIFGDPTQRGHAGAGHYPLAVVTPRGWEEADDYDPTSIIRRVSFTIRAVVRDEGEVGPFNRLDVIAAAVRGAVNGSDLDGACLPGLTRIFAGKYEGTGHFPEWSVELQGTFTAVIDTPAIPA